MLHLTLFLKLCVGHFIADYPLQGDFLAKAKNHKQPIPSVPFYQALLAHAFIQGGMVWYVTDSLAIGAIEFVLHALIDFMKSNGNLTFNQDQLAHLLCKLIYAGWLLN